MSQYGSFSSGSEIFEDTTDEPTSTVVADGKRGLSSSRPSTATGGVGPDSILSGSSPLPIGALRKESLHGSTTTTSGSELDYETPVEYPEQLGKFDSSRCS